MMYPFLTLSDETEIVHSEYLPDNTVKVYVEKPDEKDCFHHMTCILPSLTVVENFGFSKKEIENYRFVSVTDNKEGTMTKEQIVVIYTYEKIPAKVIVK